MPRSRGDNVGTNFGGVPPTKFGRAKNVQNLVRFFDNFRLWSQISHEQIGVSKIWKASDQLQFIPYSAKILGELWSTNKKVIGTHIDPPKWSFYERLYFGPYGCSPLKFLHGLQPLNCISSRIWGAGRPQVELCPIFLVCFSFFLATCARSSWSLSFLVHVNLIFRVLSYRIIDIFSERYYLQYSKVSALPFTFSYKVLPLLSIYTRVAKFEFRLRYSHCKHQLWIHWLLN